MDQTPFAKALRKNMTDAEQLLWHHLRAHRTCDQKFRRQQPIGPYIVDFVHFGARLVIEADGGQHNGSANDAVRDAWLRGQGFTVLRFWNHEILQNIEAVLEAILKELVKGAPSPLPLSRKGRGE
jgi:very-short-patch-repair endonuclease